MTNIYIIISIILIDLLIKIIMIKLFENSLYQNKYVIFRIVKNKGAFLGLFSNRPRLLHILQAVAFIISVSLYFYSSISDWSVSLIIGGGLANFIDRIKNGTVTDYFKFNIKLFPYINYADLMIFTGVITAFFSM